MSNKDQEISWALWAAYHNGTYPVTPMQMHRADDNFLGFMQSLHEMGYTIDRRKGQYFKLVQPVEAYSTIMHFDPDPIVGDILILEGEFIWYGYDNIYVRAVSPHGSPAAAHPAGSWAINAPETYLPEGWEYAGSIPGRETQETRR